MIALAQCTPSDSSICPELSEVFPELPGTSKRQKIDGEIDFYINGNSRWVIELLVQGNQIGEHMSRFDVDGRYFALRANDYVVIDFRSGPITTIRRHPKRVTVFFDRPDFSACHCVYDMEADPILISLAN